MSDGLEGIPGITPTTRTFVALVREFTRDYPELNRLVAGTESSNRQILWAILDALSDFNGTPPLIKKMSLEDLLAQGHQYLLLRMVTCSLIESVGLLQTRNHIDYSNGGFSVGVNNKTPMLQSWLQLFRQITEQRKVAVKVSMNISQLLDASHAGVYTELWAVNQSYFLF